MRRPPSPKQLHQRLLPWYRRHRRNLPWRRTRDPYAILVSEVMLQQTQVDRVIPKYKAWLRRWPTAQSLARAPLRRVLKEWSGLGYNRRAKYLRDAARMLAEKFHSHWPRQRERLRELPGVGPYTAGAIMTFSWRQPASIVDTNIARVLRRVLLCPRTPSTKQLWAVAEQNVPRRAPDEWHHGLMDLGATVCVSRQPKCAICPLRTICRAAPTIQKAGEKPRRLQSRFAHSDRFWRGRLLSAVVHGRGTTRKLLYDHLHQYGHLSVHRFTKLLEGLQAEGLLTRSRGRIRTAA